MWVPNEGERGAVKGLWACRSMPPLRAVSGMEMLSIRDTAAADTRGTGADDG